MGSGGFSMSPSMSAAMGVVSSAASCMSHHSATAHTSADVHTMVVRDSPNPHAHNPYMGRSYDPLYPHHARASPTCTPTMLYHAPTHPHHHPHNHEYVTNTPPNSQPG